MGSLSRLKPFKPMVGGDTGLEEHGGLNGRQPLDTGRLNTGEGRQQLARERDDQRVRFGDGGFCSTGAG